MENGKICSICVRQSDVDFRYDISMVFDIEKWKNDSSLYKELPSCSLRFIELQFERARSIQLNYPQMNHCGEIKFDNTSDKNNRQRDSSPFHTKSVNRPFCVFYIGGGRDFAIEFDESECRISSAIHKTL